VLVAIWIMVISDGSAHASPPDQLAGRIEDQLLSDGISLARLGQAITLTVEGTSLRVALVDRGSGKPVASRVVEQLPADQAAAVAQLTVVVSEMLRERGLVATRSPGDGWTTTFGPAAVTAYYRPTSVAVIPAGVSDRNRVEARAAAAALLAAYRAAGVTRTDDARTLGELGDAEDQVIVTRAAALPADSISIVRVYLDGTAPRAVVTLYSKTGQLVGGFTAVAGQALVAPAARGDEGGIADQVMRARPAESMPDKEGVVRFWIKSSNRQVQLLSADVAHIAAGGATGVVAINNVVCRAPCGVVVDGSLGGEYTFGGKGVIQSDRFQLIKLKGDVTATVKPARAGPRIAGNGLMFLGALAFSTGVMGSIDGYGEENRTLRNFSIGAFVASVGLSITGWMIRSSSKTTYSFTPGRPQ
jgi:hypothetical protein